MPKPKNSKIGHCEIEDRREKVSQMYLSGMTQYKIALTLGVSQPTVSQDIKAVREKWRDNANWAFNEKQELELAKIDNIEITAWNCFELSRQPLIIGKKLNKDGTDAPPVDPSTLPKRAGDDKWLKHVQWCIEMRCKIFGFVKPPETKYEDNRTVNIDFAQFVQGNNGTVPDPVEDMIRAEKAKALPPHEGE